jgi:small-conductance mechanosensitive channel
MSYSSVPFIAAWSAINTSGKNFHSYEENPTVLLLMMMLAPLCIIVLTFGGYSLYTLIMYKEIKYISNAVVVRASVNDYYTNKARTINSKRLNILIKTSNQDNLFMNSTFDPSKCIIGDNAKVELYITKKVNRWTLQDASWTPTIKSIEANCK